MAESKLLSSRPRTFGRKLFRTLPSSPMATASRVMITAVAASLRSTSALAYRGR